MLAGIDDSLWTTGLTGVGFGFPGLAATDIGSTMAGSNDSAYVRMTVCFMEQELGARLGEDTATKAHLGEMLQDVQTLLGKVR